MRTRGGAPVTFLDLGGLRRGGFNRLARHGRRLSHHRLSHGLSHRHEVQRGVVNEDVITRASHLDGPLQTLRLSGGEAAEKVRDATREAAAETGVTRPGVTETHGEASRDATTAAAEEVVHLTAAVAQIGAGAGEGEGEGAGVPVFRFKSGKSASIPFCECKSLAAFCKVLDDNIVHLESITDSLNGFTDLVNIRDEMVGALAQALYLLRLK